jgi:hypothetical protein
VSVQIRFCDVIFLSNRILAENNRPGDPLCGRQAGVRDASDISCCGLDHSEKTALRVFQKKSGDQVLYFNPEIL